MSGWRRSWRDGFEGCAALNPSSKVTALKGLKVVYRFIYCLVLTSLCLVAIWFLVGEAVAYWYRHHHQIAERIDLSEDYGFGMIVFLVDGVALLVSLPFALYWGWRLSGSRR